MYTYIYIFFHYSIIRAQQDAGAYIYIVIGLSVPVCSIRTVRKERLRLFYSTKVWCIHQAYTNCSSWHDLLMSRGGLFPWPTFHACVTMVKKKWLSLYYSTYGCYIHRTYTNCSSWHDLQMPHGGLFPWHTFHASVTRHKMAIVGPLWWFSPHNV